MWLQMIPNSKDQEWLVSEVGSCFLWWDRECGQVLDGGVKFYSDPQFFMTPIELDPDPGVGIGVERIKF